MNLKNVTCTDICTECSSFIGDRCVKYNGSVNKDSAESTKTFIVPDIEDGQK